jgi:hypothetical protein
MKATGTMKIMATIKMIITTTTITGTAKRNYFQGLTLSLQGDGVGFLASWLEI